MRVIARNVRVCRTTLDALDGCEQITQFVQREYRSNLLVEMAYSQSRVVAALNYLTSEGVSFYSDECDHAVLEALINEYFDPQGVNDNTSEESDSDTEGVA